MILGILVALQINTWNQNRLLRIEERAVISDILTDLEGDLALISMTRNELKEKDKRLMRAQAAISEDRVTNPHQLIDDLIVGAKFGWSQRVSNSTTYDDLINSGRLGIIHNEVIRKRISSYYWNAKGDIARMDERESSYPSLTYQLIPRAKSGESEEAREWEVDSELDDSKIDRLIEKILKSSIKDHITAEINLGRFTDGIFGAILERNEELSEALKNYQNMIQN